MSETVVEAPQEVNETGPFTDGEPAVPKTNMPENIQAEVSSPKLKNASESATQTMVVEIDDQEGASPLGPESKNPDPTPISWE